VTLVVEETQTTVTESPRNSLPAWHIRAGALAVDVLPAAAVAATAGLVAFTVPDRGAWWWAAVCVAGLAILLLLVNRLLLPPVTGWSLGRALFGIRVVRSDGTAAGPWRLLLRDLAHLLDTISVVGWLWPLWDSRRRTFADLLVRTEARPAEGGGPARAPRWTAGALAVATVLCLAGVAVSYLVVYSTARATERAKDQIQTEGPRIVAQMLTYDPKSLRDDFARAQSLATDKYRPQLKIQQDVVQGGHPVINEYWPADSAVQAVTPRSATMLVFLHGRRGVQPEQRYITAAVQVNFVKGGDRWRVDDLAVLTKPRAAGPEK
jgi:Mce-associated membrane protein